MNWIKLTAIILTTAIFNPLCCCLDLSAKDLDAPAPMENGHSCCSPEKPVGKDLNRHSQEECPHTSEKGSQINEAASPHDSLLKPHQALAYTLPPLEILSAEFSYQKSRATYENRNVQEPSSQRSLAYCVYLL